MEIERLSPATIMLIVTLLLIPVAAFSVYEYWNYMAKQTNTYISSEIAAVIEKTDYKLAIYPVANLSMSNLEDELYLTPYTVISYDKWTVNAIDVLIAFRDTEYEYLAITRDGNILTVEDIARSLKDEIEYLRLVKIYAGIVAPLSTALTALIMKLKTWPYLGWSSMDIFLILLLLVIISIVINTFLIGIIFKAVTGYLEVLTL